MSSARTPSMLGGILLVIGNVIGAGILALPIATAQLGLPLALLVMILFWLLMLKGALYFLRANLALPEGSNLVSMARASLGRVGAIVAWICNLLVMYSLISAYLSGGGDLISHNLETWGWSISPALGCILFLCFFGSMVMFGVARIDYVNRLLMSVKALVFCILIVGLMRHLDMGHVLLISQQTLSPALIIIVVTSYGFAPIIPSLRSYYQDDAKKVKAIILWAMGITLLVYLTWITVIFCIIPMDGAFGLQAMTQSTQPLSALQRSLRHVLHGPWVIQATNVFSSVCILTSFLTNSVALTHFLQDGLSFYKHKGKSALVFILAYTPPLAMVLFYPKAFLMGLSIAGTIAIILVLILPTLMVLRFQHKAGLGASRQQIVGYGMLMLCLALLVWTLAT